MRGEPVLRRGQAFTVQQIEEIWHNLFRMHGYARDDCKERADAILRASWARLETLLFEDRLEYLEKPPAPESRS